MCIVIIQTVNKANPAVEVCIDISVQPDGNPSDADFFLKNAGPGKYFPGEPVCHFRGKDVPTLIQWNDSGSITSGILVDALKSLERLRIYPRGNNCLNIIGWSPQPPTAPYSSIC